ncbi:MAG: hypothetical protein ABIH76_00580 [Candidatus Bathyarchaeota archaeon]
MGASVTSTTKIEIYKHDQIFNRTIRRLESASDISKNDKVSIIGLVKHLLAKGVSKPRTIKYINHLTVLARMAYKHLGQLDRKDMEMLVSQINMANYTEHTKHDYKIIIKKFYQWLRGFNEEEHEYPDEVKWIKSHPKKEVK